MATFNQNGTEPDETLVRTIQALQVAVANSASPLGNPTTAESFGASPSATAAVNTAAIQAALNKGGKVTLNTPGVYFVSTQLTIGDNTHVEIGAGVSILAAPGTAYTNPDNTHFYLFGGIFTNSNKAGGNVNIAVTGRGTVSMNNPVPGTGGQHYATGLHFENVNGLAIGGGLNITSCFRGINLFGCKNFICRDWTYQTTDLVGTGGYNDSHIYVGGQSSNGLIECVYGNCNDDIVTLNCQDVGGQTTPFAIGSINNIVIRNIYANSIGFVSGGGQVVALYGADWTNVDAVISAPPTITSITNSSTAAAWSSATTYAPGQMATYLGNTWVSATAGNLNNAPAINTTFVVNWYPLGTDNYAVVQTSAPHKMIQGSKFQVSGVAPSGYNTTAANGNASNNYGTNILTISPTLFAYCIPGSLGAASGGALKISFDMANIVIDGLFGNALQGASIGISSSVVSSGAMTNILCSRINSSAQLGTVVASGATVFNFKMSDSSPCWSSPLAPLLYSYNSAYWAERISFSGINCTLPGQQGQGAFIRLGTGGSGYDHFSFTDSALKMQTGYVGTVIGVSSQTGKSLSVSGVTVTGGPSKNALLLNGDYFPPAVKISGIHCENMNRIINLGASPTLTLSLDNITSTAMGEPCITSFAPTGAVHTIQADNVALTNQTNGFVRASPGGTGGVAIQIGNFKSDKADPNQILDSASALGTGTITVNGLQARINLASVSRLDGAICYNTNAALGTLAAAGPVSGQGTAANSWSLLANPVLKY